jgi:hypothetical protein
VRDKDLQKAFNLDMVAGKKGFRHWLGRHAPKETFLDLLQAPNPPAWGAGRLEGKEVPQAEFGVNLIGYAFGELGIGEELSVLGSIENGTHDLITTK